MNMVLAEGNQILIQESSVVAIIVDELKMVEWGQAAKTWLERYLNRLK
jgi:rod shape-determining protein MreB